jgi:hypothetical protein
LLAFYVGRECRGHIHARGKASFEVGIIPTQSAAAASSGGER